MILVSACLLGINCRYDGGNNLNEKVLKLFLEGKAIPVCPEQLGGLSTPRVPAEIIGDKVLDKNGKDVTANFEKGALETMRIARLLKCEVAILKENSPSCGVHYVYDGTFSNKKIEGMGKTCELLIKNGIKVYSENEIKKTT